MNVPLALGQLLILAAALVAAVIVSRRMAGRMVQRRTKDLLREFHSDLATLEKKLGAIITSREQIALEIDRRLFSRTHSPAPAEGAAVRDSYSWQQFRTEMPKLEEKIRQQTEKAKELVRDINRLEKEYIKVKEFASTPAGGKEPAELLSRLDAFHQSVSQTLFSSERFVSECGDTLREVITNVAPLFHLCDCCGTSGDSIFVCLNCGRRYCDNCKGIQIGHCIQCAPQYKPLHLEISE